MVFSALAVAAAIVGCDGDGSEEGIVFDAGVDGSPAADAGPLLDDAGPAEPDAAVCEGDERRAPLVYYGTREPTAMPLRPGQVYAIGTWNGCSGTFITDEWVLTASHCRVRVGRSFCVGVEPADPNICFEAVEVQDHPDRDMSLVRVDAPASTRMPALEPIPIATTVVDDGILGSIGEAAGYGSRHDGRSGIREFTAQPIVAFHRTFVVIDGEGERGVCFGDSGGPLMILADDGTVRVLGDLSYGDPSCVGRDNYERTDLLVDWIESFTGPTLVEGAGCGRLTHEGDCAPGAALYCRDEEIVSERCAAGTQCGWDTSASGYRCVALGDDPCEGVSARGECRGDVALWCEEGVLRRRDCGPCGQTCGHVAEVGGAYCEPDPCEGIDYLGECRGDTAVWCDAGRLRSRNCARRDLRCDYVDDEIGYFCTR